jgi:hypothetical protein
MAELNIRKALSLAVANGSIDFAFNDFERTKDSPAVFCERSIQKPIGITTQTDPITRIKTYSAESLNGSSYNFSISEHDILIRPRMGHFSNYD